ncbi:MAG: HAD family hydrolase [Firmicutes bacterium]|nr:HAD family hydrolase [Bacillota bacterium]
MIEAILFDLDGTLLDVDMDDFLDRYMLKLAASLSEDEKTFTKKLWASTNIMISNKDPQVTNQEAFMEHFLTWIKHPRNEVMQIIHDFYEQVFPTLQATAGPFPHTETAMAAARKLQCPLVLATNPIFPMAAIRHRMKWAGLHEKDFALITSYENMHFAKPNPEYYLEIAQLLQVNPKHCLMVGNDPVFDIRAAAQAGMITYFVDESLSGLSKDSGRLADLPQFLNSIS